MQYSLAKLRKGFVREHYTERVLGSFQNAFFDPETGKLVVLSLLDFDNKEMRYFESMMILKVLRNDIVLRSRAVPERASSFPNFKNGQNILRWAVEDENGEDLGKVSDVSLDFDAGCLMNFTCTKKKLFLLKESERIFSREQIVVMNKGKIIVRADARVRATTTLPVAVQG